MLLFPALEIALIWAVMALAFIGVGTILLARFSNDYLLGDTFWIGLAASVAFLEGWNLFLPITIWPAIIFFLTGFVALLANRSTLILVAKSTSPPFRWLVLPAMLTVFLLAYRSSGFCDYYDTGLYGAQSVRWISSYPVVPGLANLHGRLGFNSSVFLIVAALRHGTSRELAFHLFGGFMMAAFCLSLIPACIRVVAGWSAFAADWFHFVFAIPAILWATRSKIVGTLTDEPAAIATLIASGILFENFSRGHGVEREPGSARLLVAATLFSLAVSFKLSTVVFALLAFCLAVRRIFVTTPSVHQRKLFAAALIFSSAILFPWIARSVILSGYPFYPATVLGFPVDWKVPFTVARLYALGVQSFGRNPDLLIAETRGWDWARPWLHQAIRNRAGFQVPFAISLAGLAVGVFYRVRRVPRAAFPGLWLLLPSVPGILFWFLASPDMRFGQFAIWTTAATLGSYGIDSFVSAGPAKRFRTPAVASVLLLLLVWCLISFGWKEPYRALFATNTLSPLPKAQLIVRQTRSGLPVYLPANGNQSWDAPLPCTPYYDETLRLRKPPSLRWGFASELTANDLLRSAPPTAH